MTAPTPTPPDDDIESIAQMLSDVDDPAMSAHPLEHFRDVAGAILADLKRRGRLRDEPSERERIAKWQAMAREAGAVVVDGDWNVPAPAADGVTAREIDAFCLAAKVGLLGWAGDKDGCHKLGRVNIADGITAALAARSADHGR